ncbi:DNA replication licensing factor MCM7-like [Miscanthus floridulus]|uniref:DNA replication licensing factor MCM7-like n=1 Tax=Miscanthus floridulus TaxID=154761 RepID=UPI00345A1B07
MWFYHCRVKNWRTLLAKIARLAQGLQMCYWQTYMVAIHEAMEQQTISIAKASITTVYSIRGLQFLQLPIELQDAMMILRLTAQDKIDLQTTILSRFDLIFIVNDIRMYDQDKTREVAARISVGGAGPRRLGRQCGPEKRWWGRQCWLERRGPRKRWRGRMRP